MFKRGQVTIFIIVAILIVSMVVLFFIFRNNTTSRGIPQEITPFHTNLQSCLESSGEEGIHYLAAHGGYKDVPINSSIINFIDEIPYYYLDNKKILPERSTIERELEKYVSNNIEDCLNLEDFGEQGFNISMEPYTIFANINKKDIEIELTSSIRVIKGEESAALKNVEVEFKNDFNNLYEVSIEIVESYSQKPGFICLTCLDKIIENYGVNINSLPVNDISISNNDIIWFFITNKQDPSEDKLKLVFVVEK